MNTPHTPPKEGLRERKRRQAMRRIQQTALDLFDEHGYSNVTVEEVAAAADVSPSSVYRYFGTKEMLVLHDEYDFQLLAMLASDEPLTTAGQLFSELSTIVTTLIAAVDPDDEAHIERRMRYVSREPAISAHMSHAIRDAETQLRDVVARRARIAVDDVRVRIAVASLMACFLSAVFHWVETDDPRSLGEVLVEASAMGPSVGSIRFD